MTSTTENVVRTGRRFKAPPESDRSKLDDLERRLSGTPPPRSLPELITEAVGAMAAAGIEVDHLELDTGWKRPRGHDHQWYAADSGTGRTGRPWLMVTAGDAKLTGDVSTPILVWRSWEQEDRPADPSELADIKRQIEAATKARDTADVERRAAARTAAAATWDDADDAIGDHPYLATKQVRPHGIRRHGDRLLIPARDAAGELFGLQTIAPDGAKRFNHGASVAGHFHLIGDIKPGEPVYLAEGYATGATIHEATGAAVACAFNCGNLGLVAKALRDTYPHHPIIICADDDRRTEGNPGVTHATAAAAAVGGSVVIPWFTDHASHGTDFNDLAQTEGIEAVRALLGSPEPVAESLEAAVERLARLRPLDYERVRATEAKALGVRGAALDREVYAARKLTGDDPTSTPLVEEVAPHPDPVDGAELLDEIREVLIRHMALPTGAAEALALWILGSYAYDAFRIWPKLTITSPEKRCGKSTLLTGLLAPLVHRGLVASNISPAAVFRVIEAWTPTLLIDEADTFLAANEELRGIINSGHTKTGAFVVRTVGDDHEPKKFSTWSPMAIAMIKRPPSTIVDRSVVIQLRRRMPGETVEKLALTFEGGCREIRERCKRWADDHMEVLRETRPTLPASGNDRALDNWTPLLAIAETVGEHWPTSALSAFAALNEEGEEDDDIGPMILEDIRRVFAEGNLSRLHSGDLASALVALEERPWAEWRHGRPLTSTSLSRLLKPYGVKSKQLKIGGVNRFGYDLSDFADAFNRYLKPLQGPSTPFQNTTPLPPCFVKEKSESETLPGSVLESPKLPQNQFGSGVVFQNPPPTHDTAFSAEPTADADDWEVF
jgi:putative DNA primase/helicase